MKLILGLGNPGSEYARTRHNIGRRLIEFMAAQENAKLALKKPQKAALASIRWENEVIHLAYPLTYMNLSGDAVGALVKYWKIAPAKDLLVVVDDAALPFGKFRLRGEGSPGGHNGLASIEESLGSREYPRLRIGIGTLDPEAAVNSEKTLRDHVLSPFSAGEEKKMKALFEHGMEACLAWALEPLPKAMSRVNAFIV